MNWRDPKADMSVEQRAAALNAHQYNTFDDDEQFKEYIGELIAFGHACAAAAERERDTALDQLADERKANAKAARAAAYWREDHGGKLAAAERERDEARAQREALLAALRDSMQSTRQACELTQALRNESVILGATASKIEKLAGGSSLALIVRAGAEAIDRAAGLADALKPTREAIAAAEGGKG